MEELDKTRLKKEIQDAFQFFVSLMCVVEQMSITTAIPDSHYALMFVDNNKNVCGLVSDLIVSRWRNGEIPNLLGEYSFNLELPQGWHQLSGDDLIYPESIFAKVRVVGYIGKMRGKVEEFKLKEAISKKVEKFRLNANFDVSSNLIEIHQEEPIFTEEELENLKRTSKVSVVSRTKLSRIFVLNHFEPFSEKSFNIYLEKTEGLSLDEIAKLPALTVEEFEENSSSPMCEKAAMGEPVFAKNDKGKLIDVRLLYRQKKFDKIIELLPLFKKYPRQDFAEYLSDAHLLQGEKLLKSLLLQDSSIQNILKEKAFDMFSKAAELSGQAIETLLDICLIFSENKFYEEAVAYSKYVISLQPSNISALCFLAENLLKLDRTDESLEITEEIINEIPSFPDSVYLMRAKIFKTKNKFKEAAEDIMYVWNKDYKTILDKQVWRVLVSELFKDFSIVGLALIVADIYIDSASFLAEENSIEESQKYAETATNLLEDIHKIINDNHFEDSFNELFLDVQSRIQKTFVRLQSTYPTTVWINRIDNLVLTSDI